MPTLRPLIDQLPASKIREVANAAMGRSDVLAFWFGESDETTPQFIREAAMRSMAEGETFYSHNLGLAELREAIAALRRRAPSAGRRDRIAVTSSGVSALMLAMQALVGAGDEVVAVVPVWPNLTAQPAILGAHVTRFALRPAATASGSSTSMRCAQRHRPHPRPPRQFAQQPDRLDARRATSSRRCSSIAARPAPGSSPTRSTSGSSSARRATGELAPSFLDIADPTTA